MGVLKKTLIRLVEETNVKEFFNFIDRQPAQRIPEFMAICDAALICLTKNEIFALTLPAKTQSCFACGKPIIASCDGELAKLVVEANVGVVAEAGDVTALINAIISIMSKTQTERFIMGQNAIKYSDMNFNKERLLSIMDKYIKAIL